MCSVQSLVTLQGNKHTTDANDDKDGKMHVGGAGAANKDLLSAGEVDDFSLFQQPVGEGSGSGGQQETDVNNTFQEINQSGKYSGLHCFSVSLHLLDNLKDFASLTQIHYG